MTMKLRIYPSEEISFDEQINFLNSKLSKSECTIGQFLGWKDLKITELSDIFGNKKQKVLDLVGGGVDFSKIKQTKVLLGFTNFESHFVGQYRCGFRLNTNNFFVNFTTNTGDFQREWSHVIDLLRRPISKRPFFTSSNVSRDAFDLTYERFTDDFTVVDRHKINFECLDRNSLDRIRWSKRTTLSISLKPNQRETRCGKRWREWTGEVITQTGQFTKQMVLDDQRPSDEEINRPKELIGVENPTDFTI